MSLVIEKFLMCDICYESYGVDNRIYSARMHRKFSKQEGWVCIGSKDYCEECKYKIIKIKKRRNNYEL